MHLLLSITAFYPPAPLGPASHNVSLDAACPGQSWQGTCTLGGCHPLDSTGDGSSGSSRCFPLWESPATPGDQIRCLEDKGN